MTNAVQTVRAIGWLLFKWLAIAVGAMFALLAAGVAVYYVHRWYSYDRHAAKIVSHIRIDSGMCAKADFPLFVGFVNKSDATLDKVSFNVVAKIPGRSTNIAPYDPRSSDSIMKPGEGFGFCYSVPRLSEFVLELSSLNWSLNHVHYTFSD